MGLRSLKQSRLKSTLSDLHLLECKFDSLFRIKMSLLVNSCYMCVDDAITINVFVCVDNVIYVYMSSVDGKINEP